MVSVLLGASVLTNLLMLQVVGARDQRVTALVVSVLLGASVLTNLLMLQVVGAREALLQCSWG